jgi:hypothetical protein
MTGFWEMISILMPYSSISVSNLPPFLNNQEGFSGIQHDLKKITG